MESPQSYSFLSVFFPFFFSVWSFLGEISMTCVSVSPALVFSSLAWPPHPLASHGWLESEHRLACTVRKATRDSWTWRNTWVLLTTSEFYWTIFGLCSQSTVTQRSYEVVCVLGKQTINKYGLWPCLYTHGEGSGVLSTVWTLVMSLCPFLSPLETTVTCR